MTFDNNDKDEQIRMFMSEVGRQNAQLQRGYDRMAFIAGVIVGFIYVAQNPTEIQAWIFLPLFTGGVFLLIRRASKRL